MLDRFCHDFKLVMLRCVNQFCIGINISGIDCQESTGASGASAITIVIVTKHHHHFNIKSPASSSSSSLEHKSITQISNFQYPIPFSPQLPTSNTPVDIAVRCSQSEASWLGYLLALLPKASFNFRVMWYRAWRLTSIGYSDRCLDEWCGSTDRDVHISSIYPYYASLLDLMDLMDLMDFILYFIRCLLGWFGLHKFVLCSYFVFRGLDVSRTDWGARGE